MSDSVRPHRRQPTRLRHLWDSPGKNTGMGCHFLLQCMKVKSESEVAQSCPTLRDPMDCSPPASSIHGKCLQPELTVISLGSAPKSLELASHHQQHNPLWDHGFLFTKSGQTSDQLDRVAEKSIHTTGTYRMPTAC